MVGHTALLAVLLGLGSGAEHLERGKEAMKRGDFSGALDAYNSACAADPQAYSHFFSRATLYLATGRARKAAKDLETVLSLKPSFTQARTRLAELRLKDGSYTLARGLYEGFEGGAAAELETLTTVERKYANSKELLNQENYAAAASLLSQVLETSPNFAGARKLRAEAYRQLGQLGEAVGDMMRATKLVPGDVDGYLLLAKLHYETGDRSEALKQIRECVKLDGDHKPAFKFYKLLKKVVKQADKVTDYINKGQAAQALDGIQKLRELDDTTVHYQEQYATQECQLNHKIGRVEQATTACAAAIERNERNVEALLVQASLKENAEDFEGAIADLRKAGEFEENSQRIRQRLQKAERLLKQSKKRNYYKILGLPRTCTKKDVNKAYRTLAMQWHPDKFSDEEEKKVAEAKFMDIAAAKEVLSDPEKRQKFDNGEDPLDAVRASPFLPIVGHTS